MSDGKTTKTSFLKSGIGPKFFKGWMLVVVVVIAIMFVSISGYESLQFPSPLSTSQVSSVLGDHWTMSSKKNLNISSTLLNQYGYVDGFVVYYQNVSKMLILYVLEYDNVRDASLATLLLNVIGFGLYHAGYLNGYSYTYYPYINSPNGIIMLAKSNYVIVFMSENFNLSLAIGLALMKYQLSDFGPPWMLYTEIGAVILIATIISLITFRKRFNKKRDFI